MREKQQEKEQREAPRRRSSKSLTAPSSVFSIAMAANAEASAVGSLQPPTGSVSVCSASLPRRLTAPISLSSQPRTAAPSLPQATPITLAATLACTTLSPDSAHTPSPVPIATTSSLLPPPLPLSFQPLCPHALPCPDAPDCPLIHFVKALRPHTMEGLGDCSYLNSCHRMESCRYVHYRLEDPGVGYSKKVESQFNGTGTGGSKVSSKGTFAGRQSTHLVGAGQDSTSTVDQWRPSKPRRERPRQVRRRGCRPPVGNPSRGAFLSLSRPYELKY
jgi:hypothetical protein